MPPPFRPPAWDTPAKDRAADDQGSDGQPQRRRHSRGNHNHRRPPARWNVMKAAMAEAAAKVDAAREKEASTAEPHRDGERF